METNQQLVPSGTKVITLRGHNLIVPERTARLLYVSDEDPSGVSQTFGNVLTINIIGGQIKVNNLSENEPSTIFTKMLVRKPSNPDEIPRPDYYPTYAGLTPEQKWIYLNWLSQISVPVNIGYVFIYYYGLERHLLLGEFNLAFEEILLLRKYHQNQSFSFYSGAALLHSCVFRKRLDMLEKLNQSEELTDLENSELLMVFQLGFDFTADSLIKASKKIRGINQRYIKSDLVSFKATLEGCLRKRYGDAYFPFGSRYKLKDLPKQRDILFANISFPTEVRTPEIPSFLQYTPFLDEVREVFAEAHDKMKIYLRERRK
jgi:hypothetical protein